MALLTEPLRAMRLRYLPLLMIYFAYGVSTFSGIGESFFVKEKLDLSASALLMIGVWVSLPWTIKMVFGQFVDSVTIFKSRRKSYIFIAAVLMAAGSLMMAGLAGRWGWVVSMGSDNAIFIAASLITIIGVVLQDVVADAMSVEVVEREGRPQADIDKDLAMVQLLGRLSLSLGMFMVAGLGGWLAQIMTYEHLFLLTLIVPVIGVSGALLVKIDVAEQKPVNKKVLGGGLVYAVFVVATGLSQIPYGQEIVFVVSLIVIILLLKALTAEVPKQLIAGIISASVVIFIYRAVPGAGPGAQWFMIDVLGFDKSFFGTLSQIGAGLSIVGMWIFARAITQRPVGQVLTWLIVISFILGLPIIGMYYGLHEWTQQHFGFGARTIALVDTALASPFAQLAMIPMLALIAKHAPRGNAATWFALMASFMNLALTAGTLFSKFLNQIFVVTREVKDSAGHIITHADYSQLGILFILTSLIGLVIPLMAIWMLLRK